MITDSTFGLFFIADVLDILKPVNRALVRCGAADNRGHRREFGLPRNSDQSPV